MTIASTLPGAVCDEVETGDVTVDVCVASALERKLAVKHISHILHVSKAKVCSIIVATAAFLVL